MADKSLSERLLFVAHLGDTGRKPDPQDIHRIAAARIDEMLEALRLSEVALKALAMLLALQ